MLVGLGVVLAACASDPLSPGAGTTPVPASEVPVYAGTVGLVIDTRELFRRGVTPSRVEVAFAAFPALNTTLDVDPNTNLAILILENDSLTVAQRTAFKGPVAVTITVRDSGGAQLVQSQGSRQVDASNQPIRMDNPALPNTPPPIVLTAGRPYILVPRGRAVVPGMSVAVKCDDCWAADPYVRNRAEQEFYFTPVPGAANTYTIRNLTCINGMPACAGPFLHWITTAGTPKFRLGGDSVSPPGGAGRFVVVTDTSGYVRIRETLSGSYLGVPDGNCSPWCSDSTVRFRVLLAAEWDVRSLGTSFNQPVVPPARVAFASQSTIRNCSSAEVNETVGRTQARSVTTSIGTSESFQLFAQSATSVEVQIGVEVEAKYQPPDATGGFTGGVTGSYGKTSNSTMTTGSTTSTERFIQADTTEIVEVSRTRQVVVPARTGITAIDIVRTISGQQVPFTQGFLVTATDPYTGVPLSGAEIVTQMRFNLVGALIRTVGPDFVIVSVRGTVTIESLIQSEAVVREIVGACN